MQSPRKLEAGETVTVVAIWESYGCSHNFSLSHHHTRKKIPLRRISASQSPGFVCDSRWTSRCRYSKIDVDIHRIMSPITRKFDDIDRLFRSITASSADSSLVLQRWSSAPISTSRDRNSYRDKLEVEYSRKEFGRLKEKASRSFDNKTGRNWEVVEMSAFLSFSCLRFSFCLGFRRCSFRFFLIVGQRFRRRHKMPSTAAFTNSERRGGSHCESLTHKTELERRSASTTFVVAFGREPGMP